MPRYRLRIRRTQVTHEIVEVDASDLSSAATKGNAYLGGNRRGFRVVRPYDEDHGSTDEVEIASVTEA